MTQSASAVDVVLAFTEAWSAHDLAAAARYLADDVVYEGPINRHAGIQAYLDGLRPFAESTTGLEMIAAFGDDEQAMIMYDCFTDSLGTVRLAEYVTVRDGKIVSDKLLFDTYEMRRVQAAQKEAA